jgi:predicted peptidase
VPAIPSALPALIAVLVAFVTPSQAADAGRFEERSVVVGGVSHRFRVWIPPGYSRDRAWPLILFLHGAGECGTDGVKPTRIGLGPALETLPARWPFVVLFPQKTHEYEEWEECEDLVLEVLRRGEAEFRIDPARVTLAGVSQGGHGVWMIGARNAGLWSALVPVCGYGRPTTIAPRVVRLPVWAFHGARDDVVDPGDSRRIVAALRSRRSASGLDPDGARLTLYPDANHNSWDAAFGEPGLPGWILKQHRR